MNWKHDLKLRDMPPQTRLEVTCLRCGRGSYLATDALAARPELADKYLDEIERRLHCRHRGCGGRGRIAMNWQNKMEGFVGGMP